MLSKSLCNKMKPLSNNEFRINKSWAKKSFNNAAVRYDEAAVLQRKVVDHLFERLRSIHLTPDVILDIGSGTGYCARGLGGLFNQARVINLDIAFGMLTHAKAQRGFFSRLGSRLSASVWRSWSGGQQFLCGDAESLALQDDSVDLVFSSLAFQWSNDPDRLFQECYRVLRPGGLLIFSTLGPDTLKELRKSWAVADKHTHVSPFMDMHDIGDALLRSGLTNPVMEVENITLTYATVAQLMSDLKQIGSRNATAGRAPGLTGKKALHAMTQAYEAFRKDGSLPASYEVVYGHAWIPERKRHSFSKNHPLGVSINKLTEIPINKNVSA